jgi:NAD-dependent dihydropyrimidine dehydrogenase PreA subunit
MYIVTIDSQKCTGDGECVDVCATELIQLQEVDGKKIAVVTGNLEDCLGCESCIVACPSEAITLSED